MPLFNPHSHPHEDYAACHSAMANIDVNANTHTREPELGQTRACRRLGCAVWILALCLFIAVHVHTRISSMLSGDPVTQCPRERALPGKIYTFVLNDTTEPSGRVVCVCLCCCEITPLRSKTMDTRSVRSGMKLDGCETKVYEMYICSECVTSEIDVWSTAN